MHGIRPRQKITQADWAGYMAQRAERASSPALQQFFSTPLPDPETPIAEVPMVALDMETTLAEASIAYHHITHSEIAEAPDLETILDDLLAQLAGRLVVVHFRNIERPFLDAAVKARRGEGVLFPMIDTMSLEARLHRQTLWARFRRWLGRPPVSIRLHASRERYGLPAYQGHHALVDALATAELLQAQIATHYRPETPLKDIWC